MFAGPRLLLVFGYVLTRNISIIFDLGCGKKSPPKTHCLLQETPNFKLCHNPKKYCCPVTLDFHPLALTQHTPPLTPRTSHTHCFWPSWETPPSSSRLPRSLRVCWPRCCRCSSLATAVGVCYYCCGCLLCAFVCLVVLDFCWSSAACPPPQSHRAHHILLRLLPRCCRCSSLATAVCGCLLWSFVLLWVYTRRV